jgi:hypothetical protein
MIVVSFLETHLDDFFSLPLTRSFLRFFSLSLFSFLKTKSFLQSFIIVHNFGQHGARRRTLYGYMGGVI